MANDVVNEVVEFVAAKLLRKSGTFVKDNGEKIDYIKYSIVVGGAELSVGFDKDVKSLISTFIKFEPIK